MITLRRIGLYASLPEPEFDPVSPLARTQPELDLIHLLSGRVYIIGRHDVDIQFKGDGSISRKHGKLEMIHPAGNVTIPELKPHLIIEDLGSKHGTYINTGIETDKKITSYEPEVLSVGSKIRFGKQWNVYIVEYTPLLVCTSSIGDDELLTDTVRLLGGHRLESAQHSTHLVMDLMIMTSKLLLALMSLQTIVTPEYFYDLIGFYQGSSAIKPASAYLPPTDEPQLMGNENKCLVNQGRRALFTGKYFLFAASCASGVMKQVIKLGQGRAGLLANRNLSKAVIQNENTLVVVDLEKMAELDIVEKCVLGSYMEKRTRPIEVWQICLAVIHVNLDPYCNPYKPSPPRLRRTDSKDNSAKTEPTSPLKKED